MAGTNPQASQFNVSAQNITGAWEKAIAEQTARLQTVFGELGKLESKGVAQATSFLDETAHLAKEQLAFVEQLSSQWRRLAIDGTRKVAELFVPKV